MLLTVSPGRVGFDPAPDRGGAAPTAPEASAAPSGPERGRRDTFRLPFPEQIAFFRQKLKLPSERWDSIERAAHDRGFIVAGAQKADLLTDLHNAVEQAIREGKSIQWFRQNFEAIVAKHGWTGWTGEGTKAGVAWRTRVIYNTNLSASYAAGRFAQLTEAGFGLWVYRHSDSVLHPRPLHLAWNGLALPPDHPFWKTHYPPNGWGCHCYVVGARSESGARRLGGDPDKRVDPDWSETDPKTGAPVGIDKGWNYAPGAGVDASLRQVVQDKLITYRPAITTALSRDVARYINANDRPAEFARRVLADTRSLSDYGFTRVGILGIENFSGALAG
ncbi:phage minor head protein [Methylococcus sp. ANG]|uniref:phage head morphogenesis protein n=1 Tax=Methylococcus sp. ANG TaxID=3231903 RepID=UPI003457A909